MNLIDKYREIFKILFDRIKIINYIIVRPQFIFNYFKPFIKPFTRLYLRFVGNGN